MDRLAGIQAWFQRAKAMGTRAMDVVEIFFLSAFYALLWIIPLYLVLLYAVLVFFPAPDPLSGLRPPAWLPYLIGAPVVSAYVVLVLGYLYVRLVRKQTVPEFIKEKPRLRGIAFLAASAVEKALAAVDGFFGAIGNVLGITLTIGVIILLVLIGLAILYWIGSAAFSSAPWWAVVIIILLIMILMK